jgi:hypothetical protein
MTDPSAVPERPESHGWLRRPELDQTDGVAWETPIGDVHFHPRRAFDPSVPPDNRHFATEAVLTAMVLHAAQISAPGIEAIALQLVEPDETGCNWRVAALLTGSAEPNEARRAVTDAVASYRLFWRMAADHGL